MQGFVKLAEGIDVLPLKMAVERQVSVFEEGQVRLFAEGEWQGQFYAFPQLRSLLLDMMRRVECGKLVSITLLQVETIAPLDPLLDGQQCFVILALSDFIINGAGAQRPGDVLWSNGAVPVVFRGTEEGGFALVVCFEPIP